MALCVVSCETDKNAREQCMNTECRIDSLLKLNYNLLWIVCVSIDRMNSRKNRILVLGFCFYFLPRLIDALLMASTSFVSRARLPHECIMQKHQLYMTHTHNPKEITTAVPCTTHTNKSDILRGVPVPVFFICNARNSR